MASLLLRPLPSSLTSLPSLLPQPHPSLLTSLPSLLPRLHPSFFARTLRSLGRNRKRSRKLGKIAEAQAASNLQLAQLPSLRLMLSYPTKLQSLSQRLLRPTPDQELGGSGNRAHRRARQRSASRPCSRGLPAAAAGSRARAYHAGAAAARARCSAQSRVASSPWVSTECTCHVVRLLPASFEGVSARACRLSDGTLLRAPCDWPDPCRASPPSRACRESQSGRQRPFREHGGSEKKRAGCLPSQASQVKASQVRNGA